jgi:hypothetical protein
MVSVKYSWFDSRVSWFKFWFYNLKKETESLSETLASLNHLTWLSVRKAVIEFIRLKPYKGKVVPLQA